MRDRALHARARPSGGGARRRKTRTARRAPFRPTPRSRPRLRLSGPPLLGHGRGRGPDAPRTLLERGVSRIPARASPRRTRCAAAEVRSETSRGPRPLVRRGGALVVPEQPRVEVRRRRPVSLPARPRRPRRRRRSRRRRVGLDETAPLRRNRPCRRSPPPPSPTPTRTPTPPQTHAAAPHPPARRRRASATRIPLPAAARAHPGRRPPLPPRRSSRARTLRRRSAPPRAAPARAGGVTHGATVPSTQSMTATSTDSGHRSEPGCAPASARERRVPHALLVLERCRRAARARSSSNARATEPSTPRTTSTG